MTTIDAICNAIWNGQVDNEFDTIAKAIKLRESAIAVEATAGSILLTEAEYRFAQHNALDIARYDGFTLDAKTGLPTDAAGLGMLAVYAAERIAASPDDGGAFFRRQTRTLQKALCAKIKEAIKSGKPLVLDPTEG